MTTPERAEAESGTISLQMDALAVLLLAAALLWLLCCALLLLTSLSVAVNERGTQGGARGSAPKGGGTRFARLASFFPLR